jgi:glycosyltransferase involved in cell wall biosynthesis
VKIAQVAPLYESVPPRLYGGTERIVSYLTEELVRMGHEVTLFASGDSVTQARLVSPCTRSLRLDSTTKDPIAPHVLLVEEVLQEARNFDIIHFHTEHVHFPVLRRLKVPHVTTLHGRLDLPELRPFYREFREMPLISISDSQRAPLPFANWRGTVHHGLPPDLLEFSGEKGSYLAFLGRISPEKHCDWAIRIACRAGLPLRIAAKVSQEDRPYFETTIRPLLGEPGIEFLGEIGEAEKSAFLGKAIALLFPIDWPEPFGLVMIEAFATGTPVIARPCGSVPEVVDDGVSGFLGQTLEDLTRAVRRIDRLSRNDCRRRFDSEFTAQRMARDYVEIYHRLLHRRPAWKK